MSRLGLGLVGAYVLTTLACVIAGHLASDGKGHHVLMQLPIALQGAALSSLGYDAALASMSWVSAFALIGGGTVVVLYLVGALVGRALR